MYFPDYVTEKNKQKARLSLELSPDLKERIRQFVEDYSLDSMDGVFRDGVCFLLDHIDRVRKGYVLRYVKKDDPSDYVEVNLVPYDRFCRLKED